MPSTRRRGAGASPRRALVQKILVATDQSESASHAVRWAADMAERFSAELVLLQVRDASGRIGNSAIARALDWLRWEGPELGVRVVNLSLGGDPALREWGLRMIIVSRCLERIGDHAVDIGEQTAYLVSGEFREFTDASHGPGTTPRDLGR